MLTAVASPCYGPCDLSVAAPHKVVHTHLPRECRKVAAAGLSDDTLHMCTCAPSLEPVPWLGRDGGTPRRLARPPGITCYSRPHFHKGRPVSRPGQYAPAEQPGNDVDELHQIRATGLTSECGCASKP